MTLSDLKLQIETTLFTTSKHFRLGEMCILAVLFLLLSHRRDPVPRVFSTSSRSFQDSTTRMTERGLTNDSV